jgi:DNA-binding IclR family transcriptional regulator
MEEKINKSIDRALQILELFSMEKPAWGITEISKALNMYKSNVYNILFTLAERGFIKKDPNTEKYSLSIKYFELGSIVIKNMDLRKIALPYIEKLFQEFNETVHLGVLDKDRVVSIEREESKQGLYSHIEIGKSAPLHCTAVGKSIMAYLSSDKVNSLIKEKGLKKYTDNTITNKEELVIELEKIQKQGYAIDNIEHEEGVRCLAGSIRDYRGEVIASLSVSGPAFRIDEKDVACIIKKIKEYCNYISKEIGYLN